LTGRGDDPLGIPGTRAVSPLCEADPSSLGYRTEVSSPRSLLRLRCVDDAEFVLCPFEETVSAFAKGLLTLSVVHRHVRCAFPPRSIEEALDLSKKGLSAFRALLYRLSRCERGRREARDPREELWWSLHGDGHLDLALYVRERGRWTDKDLSEARSNELEVSHPVSETLCPDTLARVPCWWNGPDLSGVVDLANVWYDIRSGPRVETSLAALVHIIASKTQSHKCQVRNYAKSSNDDSILDKYFETFPLLVDLFRILVEIFLLGNSPGERNRLPFHRRLEVHVLTARHSLARPTDDEFREWVCNNDRLVYLVARSAYYDAVSDMPPLEERMRQTIFYDESRTVTRDLAALARRRIAEKGMEALEPLKEQLEDGHSRNLSYITKLKKGHWTRMFLDALDVHVEKNVVDPFSVEPENDRQWFSEEVAEAMDAVVAVRYPPRRSALFEVRWLKVFGVSEAFYDLTRGMYYDYEVEDVADNAIPRLVNVLDACSRRDTMVLRAYLKRIKKRQETASFPVHASMARNQTMALRHKIHVPPCDDLSEENRTFYYCDTCQDWAHPVIDIPVADLAHIKIYSQGCDKALYDSFSKKLFCGKRRPSALVKKLAEYGDRYDPGATSKKKASYAKIAREHKVLATKCRNEPLVGVQGPGWLHRVGEALWTPCEICGTMSSYHAAKMGPLGFTCGFHRLPDPMPEIGKDAARDPSRCESCDGRATRHFTVMDDASVYRLGHREMSLCEADATKAADCFRYDQIPLLSTVMEEIAKESYRRQEAQAVMYGSTATTLKGKAKKKRP
jgi:hypothetical protein